MSQPYVGEIRMFAGTFAPAGWATCDGQQMSIADNDTLFNLIGTTYGGDGQTYFNLPNLSGRVPNHMGMGNGLSNYILSQTGGVTSVTVSTQQLPSHTHPVIADAKAATTSNPTNAYPADASPDLVYTVPNSANNPDAAALRSMNPNMLAGSGGSQPHDNMQPYLAVTYIIALYGIYPTQN